MKEVRVPVLPESISEATVAAWHKKPGDYVDLDDVIVEIETDKVVLEVPAEESGVLTEISAREGETVTEKQVLGMIDNEADSKSIEPKEDSVDKEEAIPAPEANHQEENNNQEELTSKTAFGKLCIIQMHPNIRQPNGRKSSDDSHSKNHS